MPIPFTYRSGALTCDRVPLARLAADHGTPLYVYSATAFRSRFRLFDRAFRALPHTICYSVKANSNLALLSLLAGLGAGFDVVSGGELERVLRAHKSAAAKVVFSGVGKTADEMDAALRAGILLFNVESESELDLLAARASRLRKRAALALRVNPDVPADTHPYISTGLREHKFGVPLDDAERLYALAARHASLEVAGVSVHIGSQITNPEPFAAAMERVASLVRALRRAGHRIRFVDAGGGLGISYQHPADRVSPARAAQLRVAGARVAQATSPVRRRTAPQTPDASPQPSPPAFSDRIASYARAVLPPLRKLNVHLLLEPGRALVGPAGALLARVLYSKQNGAKRFLIVDAAMNDLIRPSLYGAYHEIVPVEQYPSGISPSSGLGTQDSRLTFDVVGPICETGDFFARDRQLPPLDSGDLIAILDAGAYGMSLASNYNTRLRAAEVLVDGSSSRLIRRRESLDDLLRPEKV